MDWFLSLNPYNYSLDLDLKNMATDPQSYRDFRKRGHTWDQDKHSE